MKAKTLKLKKNQSTLPTELLFEGITHLEVYGGSLESIDPRWFAIPTLEVLRLKNVGLTKLPEEMTSFAPRLHTLVLSQNHLELIPDWVANFKNLKVMDVGSNAIAHLPAKLPLTLQRLIADSNQLATLPPALFELHSLLHLSLEENPLSEECRQKLFARFGIWVG